MKQPTITFIAGPNGSGKSTLTSGNRDFFSAFPLLDPDAIANTIQADNKNLNPMAAGREVLASIEQNLKDRRTFAVETTFSGKVYLQTMQEARRMGFNVCLIYVGTSDVQINLARVRKRVALKGHNVPESDIRRRYQRSLANLTTAVPRTDLAILLDNSKSIDEGHGSHAYDLVAIIENGKSQWFEPIPAWALPLQASFTK